jgi:hypothetical protein
MMLKKIAMLAMSVPSENVAAGGGASGAPAAAAAPAKVKFADKDYDVETGEFEIAFGNGQSVKCMVYELPAEIQKLLMLHGASQKIGDSYAGVKKNYDEAIKNANDVIEQLKAGSWKSLGGDEARPRLGELAEAISRIKGTDLEKTKLAVEKATDEQRKTWRTNNKVKAVIAQLRAEKAQAELEAAGEKELDIAVEA